MNKLKQFIFLLIISFFLLSTIPVLAVEYYEENPDFNHNYIISDNDMVDGQAWDIQDVQDFLVSRGGALAGYIDPANNQTAAWIIWSTSQEFGINPKFLLTLLQKEQSLVEDPEPTQNQYDWAVGYSCYGGTCLDQYRGFTTQLRSAADRFINTYIKQLNESGCTFTNWCVGIPKMTQDGVLVTPVNKATASLYTYNPYRGGTIVDGDWIGANYNFWKIWHRWFETSAFYPDGSLLKTASDPTVWLIKDGQKRAFDNWTSLITRYDAGNILIVSPTQLDDYPIGSIIKYPQYALLEDPNNIRYLLVNDYKRKIYDNATFQNLGFNPEELITVSQEEIDSIPTGEILTIGNSYPLGGLLQNALNGAVFFVQNGKKYPIVDKSIMEINYPTYKIIRVSVDELEKYPTGPAILFRDGTLVKTETDPKVYVISNGQKRPISDELTFNTLGYAWEKIKATTANALNIHPTGEALEIIVNTIE